MNRKKCKASGGPASNSNQNNSTVPWNNAVEVGDMVTTDHVGTSVVDLDEDGEQLDYLAVAWLLREELNDFVEGGKGRPPGLELQSLLNMAASRKIISVDSKNMSRVLWKTLPKELLAHVLARLPLHDITRLRSLSKEWNRDMVTLNSEINRALDETSPTMVAGFSFSDYWTSSEFLVTICDLSTQRSQYSYRLHLRDPNSHENQWDYMDAHDGGLFCFVSTWRPSKANPLCIVVVNFLTRVQRKLPPLKYVYFTPPKMMDIKVDSKTKYYRVVVVGKNVKGRPTVEIYDSGARQWTKATSPRGLIFGVTHKWKYNDYRYRAYYKAFTTHSVYDFARGQLKHCDERGPSREASVMTYELQKDCMFVLHRNTLNGEILQVGSYCITKYRIQNNAKDWVQERSYLCSPFEDFLEKDCGRITLKACEGFLMVFSYRTLGHFWLLELSSGKWSSLPNYFEGHKNYEILMTRASWNVVP